MAEFIRITESESHHKNLEKCSVISILKGINDEDKLVADAVEKALPAIEPLVQIITDHMLAGGRLFYIGAGTSGRLGILDASEIPPTYGMPHGLVIGLIAGGDAAIRKPIENAEDSRTQSWIDLQAYDISDKDVVIGIAASGTTPYVISALENCKKHGIVTGCITCNPGAPLTAVADYPIEVIVGPEFVTGSTRMKSGTAQKLVLNMISTTVMIQIGRVEGNRMVHMQLTNDKLVDRGTKMLMQQTGLQNYDEAQKLLLIHGSVKKAVVALKDNSSSH